MQQINILISTYNGKKYIKEQLDSIVLQSYQKFHIYIRDDGSIDGTEKLISQYIIDNHLEDKITLVEGENIGFSQSFKCLLDISSQGDYWAFCDQDDVWYPDKLKNAILWMNTQDDSIPLLYHSGIEISDENLFGKTRYSIGGFGYSFYNAFTSNVFFGFATMINKVAYEKVIKADFNQIKYHDWFVAMIVATFGKYHFSEKIDAIHRVHSQNASPLIMIKKIPDGIKLLKGDDFYNRNAREFWRLFSTELTESQRQHCLMFINEEYNFKTACRKAFYAKRWNPQLKVEIILRVLMLIGKI